MLLEPRKIDRNLASLQSLYALKNLIRALGAFQSQKGRCAHQILQLPGDVTIAHKRRVYTCIAYHKVIVNVSEQFESIL